MPCGRAEAQTAPTTVPALPRRQLRQSANAQPQQLPVGPSSLFLSPMDSSEAQGGLGSLAVPSRRARRAGSSTRCCTTCPAASHTSTSPRHRLRVHNPHPHNAFGGAQSVCFSFLASSDACIEYLPLSLRYLYLSDNSITNAVRVRVMHSACVSIKYSHTRQGVDDIPPHVDTLALDYTLISVDKEAAVLEQFTSLRSLSLSASEYIPLHNRPDAVVTKTNFIFSGE